MKLTLLLFAAACLLAGAPIAAERRTVTTGEGYFPVLIRLKDGTLMGVIRGGAPHIGVGGRLEIVASKNNGATWSKPRTVVDGPEDDRNPAFGQLKNGDLLLSYTIIRGYEADGLHMKAKKREERIVEGVYVVRSSDGGATWSAPVLSEAIHALQKNGGTISPYGKMVEVADGTVLMSVYCEFFDGRGHRTFIARSKDNGRTWGDLSEVGHDVNETALLALPDGSLVAAMRSEKEPRLSTSISRDGGRTWSTPTQVTQGMEHPADLIRLKNGDVLLSFGIRNAPHGVAALLSHDGGKTWDTEHRILLADDATNVDCGYPSSVQLPDGRIVTMYYQVDDPKMTPGSAKSKVAIWKLPR